MEDVIHDSVKCLVCMDICGKLMQCFNGHIVCTHCLHNMYQKQPYTRNGSISCPVCRSSKSWTYNSAVVKIAHEYGIRVNCGISGCPRENLLITEVDDHRLNCPHQKFACPIHFHECAIMTMPKLLSHINTCPGVTRMASRECNAGIVIFGCSNVSRIIVFNKQVIIFNINFNIRMFSSEYRNYQIELATYGNFADAQIVATIQNIDFSSAASETCVVELTRVDDYKDVPVVFQPQSFENVVHTSDSVMDSSPLIRVSDSKLTNNDLKAIARHDIKRSYRDGLLHDNINDAVDIFGLCVSFRELS